MLAAFAAVVFSAPDLSDDFWYRCEFVRTAAPDNYQGNYSGFENCEGPHIHSLHQVASSWHNHLLYWNNGRIANLLMFFTNFIPSWLVDLLQVVFMALLALMLLCLCTYGRWRERPLLSVAVLWAVWIVLPWYNQMLSTVYMISYIHSTAFALTTVWLALHTHCRVWIVALLAFISGLMHEGIALPIACGLAATAIACKELRPRTLWPTLAIFSAIIIICLNPSLLQRMGWDNAGTSRPLIRTLHFLLTRMWILPLFISISGIYFLRCGRKRASAFIHANLLWITAASVSTLFGLYTGQFDRQVWIGDVALIILLARMAPTLLLPASIKAGIASTLCLSLGIWLSAIAWYQHLGAREFDAVRRQIVATSNREPFYVDIRPPYSLPWWLLEIPEMYANQYAILRINHRKYITGQYAQDPLILPARYQGKNFSSLPEIPGSAHLRGVFPCFYSPVKLNPSASKLLFTLNNGRTYHFSVEQRPVPLAPSDTAWFYFPTEWSRSAYRLKIKSIDL